MDEMRINEPEQALANVEYKFYGRGGEPAFEEEVVLQEHVLEIYVNGGLTMRVVCLPTDLEELVLGRLLTENIISGINDVQSLMISDDGCRADVTLSPSDSDDMADDAFVDTLKTTGGGNRVLDRRFVKNTELKKLMPIRWEPEWIFRLADAFAAGTPLHEKTWAAHSCFLAMEDHTLFACEDIGRHNALDKAIGFALRNEIDLGRCIVYSSGRIPVDMAEKAIKAGIPVLASKASPTRQAIELAKAYGLTLICQARKDRMKQYA